MRLIIIISLSILFTSCGNLGNSSADTSGVNLSGYTTEVLSNGVTRALKYNSGILVEEGFVSNGKMNGTWTTYTSDGLIKSTTTFSNNVKTGPHLEFTNRGQIELRAHYDNGELHGPYAKYRNGRAMLESNYKNGKQDGVRKEYFESGINTGKLRLFAEFKNGKQDGKMEYYDEEGNITLTYIFKNGEKVNGGM